MATSNHLIGFLNFLTFLLSVPITGGGVWLSSRANTTDCMQFLQWPLIILGVSIMLLSLAGFVGACYRNTFLIYLYLWAMFFVIVALIFFVIFAYSVTDRGSGRPIADRAYLDYSIQDYSGNWLADRVQSPMYWTQISSCIRESRVCPKLRRSAMGIPEPPQLFYLRKLTPVQSGCCKPPTSCGYAYVNETFWDSEGGTTGIVDPDCLIWSNDQEQLCYNCASCEAGVLASLKTSWRKVSAIDVAILIALVLLYVVACAAFRHNKHLDSNEPQGETRMVKAKPSRLPF